MHKSRRSHFFVALFTLVTIAATAAQAQTVINSLPYTINTPGDYVLGGNLSYNATSGNAITFNVGNATLDFAGHYISNLAAGNGTTAYGLYGNNRANITVQNGTVVGFAIGIYFNGDAASSGGNNTGNVITNMRLPSNTYIGIDILNPTTCRVENCQINKTGGSTSFNGPTYSTLVVDGSVVLRNNQVSALGPTSGLSRYGIYCISSTKHFVIGNQIDSCDVGLLMDNNAGKRQDNLTANCTTPFQGGIDAGGNN